MKLLESTKKCSLIVLGVTLLISWGISAKPVALVSALKGDIFFTANGTTKQLQLGMHLPSGAEIFSELGSQLTLTDYYDHHYHIAGSGHIQITDNHIKLFSGYLWVQSAQESVEAQIETANAVVSYIKGDGILSFDSVAGKSQLLVVSGDFSLANLINPELKTSVYEGQFSFITTEQQNPRRPTPCGFQSFKKVTMLFPGVRPMEKGSFQRIANQKTVKSKIMRKIASVEQPKKVKRGRVILAFHDGVRAPASVTDDTYISKLYAKELKKLAKLGRKPKRKIGRAIATKHSAVKVQIFDGSMIHATPVKHDMPVWKVKVRKTTRGPASVKNYSGQVKVQYQDSEFSSSIQQHFKSQMKHSNEVNKLIDELQSYDQDFTKSY